MFAFTIGFLIELSVLPTSAAAPAVTKEVRVAYLAEHSDLIRLSPGERSEYLSFVGRVLERMEEPGNFDAADYHTSDRGLFALLLSEFKGEAWAHGDHAHESPAKPAPTRETAPKAEPTADEYFNSLAEQAKKNEISQKSQPMDESAGKSSPAKSRTEGVECAIGRCCIHSGNLIPLTGGRCLGAAYISCQTTDAKEGFKCNPLIFGVNAKQKPICVPKGPPHNYTDQCNKLSDIKITLQYVEANAKAWNTFQGALAAYCGSKNVPAHNKPNCEVLKKRAASLGKDKPKTDDSSFSAPTSK